MTWNNVFFAQVKDCLELQHTLNKILIGESYTHNPPNFIRAFRQETAEMVDWTPWKWWKAMPEANNEQIKIEVIDCFHFLLSGLLVENHSGSSIGKWLVKGLFTTPDTTLARLLSQPAAAAIPTSSKLDDLSTDELLTGVSNCMRMDAMSDAVILFAVVMQTVNLSWDEMYKKYIAKNLLNWFRSENGYKEGHYVKIWFGEEDNDVLMEYVNKANVSDVNFVANCSAYLIQQYKLVLTNA
jgi:dimeric dUTPase (all-alpha-NTP-PPase superfamily)